MFHVQLTSRSGGKVSWLIDSDDGVYSPTPDREFATTYTEREARYATDSIPNEIAMRFEISIVPAT